MYYCCAVKCSEVVQDMVLGTPDAPCSGFMREMQVHCTLKEWNTKIIIMLSIFVDKIPFFFSLSLAGFMLNTSQNFNVKKRSANSKREEISVESCTFRSLSLVSTRLSMLHADL